MTHSRKGKTVMTDKERYESVRHCKWVDEVVESAPWTVDQAFLDKHKVHILPQNTILSAFSVFLFTSCQSLSSVLTVVRFLPCLVFFFCDTIDGIANRSIMLHMTTFPTSPWIVTMCMRLSRRKEASCPQTVQMACRPLI